MKLRTPPPFSLAALGIALGAASLVSAPSYQLNEYIWSNPEFRERVVGLYATHATIEPTIDREDSMFLRETLLPLLETDPPAAIEEVETYLQTKDAPALYLVLGNLYLEEDLLFEAESAFESAVSRHDSFRRAWRGLAITRFRQDRHRESIQPWLRVITLGGGDDQSYGLLGYAYLATDQPYPALESFRSARMYAPQAGDLIRGELESLRRLKRPADALALLPELRAVEPENTELWLLEANLHLQLDNIRRAAAALETAHALGEESPGSLRLLGDCFLELGLPQPALRSYTAAVSGPEKLSPSKRITVLRQLADRGHLSTARSFAEQMEGDREWVESLPDSERADFNRVRAQFAFELDGDPGLAHEFARTAVELDPLDRAALMLAGQIEEALGNLPAARLLYERATRTGGNPFNAWLALGQLELEAGNPAAALDAWKTARSHLASPALDRAIERLETQSGFR